jgi:hypothetical protein
VYEAARLDAESRLETGKKVWDIFKHNIMFKNNKIIGLLEHIISNQTEFAEIIRVNMLSTMPEVMQLRMEFLDNTSREALGHIKQLFQANTSVRKSVNETHDSIVDIYGAF